MEPSRGISLKAAKLPIVPKLGKKAVKATKIEPKATRFHQVRASLGRSKVWWCSFVQLSRVGSEKIGERVRLFLR